MHPWNHCLHKPQLPSLKIYILLIQGQPQHEGEMNEEEKKNLDYSLQHNADVRCKEKAAFLSVLLGLLLVAHHCCVQGPVVGGRVEVAQGKAGSTAPVVVYLQPHSNRSSVTQAG